MGRRRVITRLSAVLTAVVLAACSGTGSAASCATCKSGLSLLVRDLIPAVPRGSTLAAEVCLDGDCHAITLTRDLNAQTPFVEFAKLTKTARHTITFKTTGDTTGGAPLAGRFEGDVVVVETPTPKSCTKVCHVATIKIDSSGAPIPGTPVKATASTSAGG